MLKKLPRITVSVPDAERLDQVLRDPRHATSPAANALRAELDRAELVERREVAPDVVTMNSRVRFRIAGASVCRTLSYPAEAGTGEGRISVLAPVGSAILGLRVGYSIAWPRPGGDSLDVHVEEILYQPERDGPNAIVPRQRLAV